ncbi:LOW QUALITY PROTEIN: hypothetical protein OSB04_019239 [Centaurea solstitialis]|uniref:Reverse transcriptase Ty1/copia-type domain-containing protein n=1 Tax=Centaurea solstitialis TaxID=347529 RepID=A0AA38WFP7_9ASTR|nr:LOW QUALITY PROTEIN: hypothetical protein OSB04_019239 [Centaurea solstitialis]
MSATQPHKLSPRSTQCVFLGYPSDFRGYRCYDPHTGRVHLSRHVTFDENTFPFHATPPKDHYNFLDDDPILLDHTSFPTTNIPNTQPQCPPSPVPILSDQPPTTPIPPSTLPTVPESPSPSSAESPTTTLHSPIAPPPTNTHPMQTRTKDGILKPNSCYIFATSTNISPIPTSYTKAFSDPNWLTAMNDEFSALPANNTWVLVPRPTDQPVIRALWLFRHKFKVDGSLERYKAQLVCNGNIDCMETFSLVIKPATIRTVLSLAVSRSWPIHQLDVKNAFLHGNLQEPCSCNNHRVLSTQHIPIMCVGYRSRYTASNRLHVHGFLTTLGFRCSLSDTLLFIYHNGDQMAYLLLYVDDIVLTASHVPLLKQIIINLSQEFAMSDLGLLHHFLGIAVTRQGNSLFLGQTQYARDILHRENMTNCKPCHAPVDTNSKLGASDGPLLPDGSLYRSLAGALQYLTITRPDLSYVVQQICLFMHAPREPHMMFMKWVLRYLHGTLDHGLNLLASSDSSLTAYSDADWGDAPTHDAQRLGIAFFLGLTSSAGLQNANPQFPGPARRLNTEECPMMWQRPHGCAIFYMSFAFLSARPQLSTVITYRPSTCLATRFSINEACRNGYSFFREKIGHIRVLHIPSSNQYTDIFTKGLGGFKCEPLFGCEREDSPERDTWRMTRRHVKSTREVHLQTVKTHGCIRPYRTRPTTGC